MLLAALDLGVLIKLGVGLVVLVVALINRFAAKAQENADRAARPRPLPRPRAQGGGRAGHEDIDQFLDHVLGRRPQGGGPGQDRTPADDVVVLRPSPARSAAPRPRPDPRAAARSGSAARVPKAARPPEAEPATPPPLVANDPNAVDSARQISNQASAAMQAAAALQPAEQQTARRGEFDVRTVLGALRTAKDVRRALVLSEVLGPPRSRRGR